MHWKLVLWTVYFVAILGINGWCLARMVWLNHIEPKWKRWFKAGHEMLHRGEFPDDAEYAAILLSIDQDMESKNPLTWIRRWRGEYPLPSVKKSHRDVTNLLRDFQAGKGGLN